MRVLLPLIFILHKLCTAAAPAPHIKVMTQGRVLALPLEDYALGVVSAEIADGRGNTAYVRALARTVLRYSTLHRGRHKKAGYDFCDKTHCQVYRGVPPDEKRLRAMCEGLKPLKRGGGFFQRCCGGKLEEEEVVWGKKKSGKIISCGYCKSDNFYEWEALIPRSQWLAAAGEGATSLRAKDISPAGRHLRFEIDTPQGKRDLDAWKFYSDYGKRFGWADLHSLWFDFKEEGNMVKVKGRGLGHGVGLCQSGALELAKMGWSDEKILRFYFPD